MPKFGEILLNGNLITKEELNLCLQAQQFEPKERIGSFLKHYNFIDGLRIAELIAKEIGWALFAEEYIPDDEVIKEIGLDFFNKNHIYPVKEGQRTVFVVSYIDNVEVTDFLRSRLLLNHEDKYVFAIGNEIDVRNALDLLVIEETRKLMNAAALDIKGDDEDKLTAWLDNLIKKAVFTRSTDIHIEPTLKATEVRFRIDGILKFVCCVKKKYMNAIANIILSRCHANPGEYNFQEGGFCLKFPDNNKDYDIRFSQVPSVFGPAIVLRLHDKIRASIPLKKLGFTDHNWTCISQVLKKPHGIVLVTGPTGCGKSTSLYGMLNEIKSIGKKILTVEDPIEINHSLMTQLQINLAQQVTFARSIRAFLRHDPDIILVGEIRDRETAQEAVRASITGHQVFSTLHTNGPIEAVLRLKDLGIEPVNIASSLLAVVSQRLVRTLCRHCKEDVPVGKKGLDEYEAKYLIGEVQVVSRPHGCEKCNDGYWGRTVVAEVMIVDDQIKGLIGKDRLGDLPQWLRARGHKTIADNAAHLISKRIISLEEAVRVLG
jgi:type II secretory ATPase GspE/PulE/Tfp pilus assembly ATPase PilB-like protein